MYRNRNHRFDDKLSDCKTKCKCGHTQLVAPKKGVEYTLCSWCGSRLYLDKEKQKEYDKKAECEKFRWEFSQYLKSYKNCDNIGI